MNIIRKNIHEYIWIFEYSLHSGHKELSARITPSLLVSLFSFYIISVFQIQIIKKALIHVD